MKQLKSQLAALDRKITVELAPKHEENDGTENKQEQSQHTKVEGEAHMMDSPSYSRSQKPSMVAEPYTSYPPTVNTPRFTSRRSAI